jgi:hypothetical protein
MDSKIVEVHGLIKGLQVHLASFPDIQIEMNIVVIDVPDSWGMFLSRKTTANFGGSIQMDLTYATIPTTYGAMFRLNRELERNYHVEDSKKPIDELVYHELEMGCYEISSNFLASVKEELKDELPSVCNVCNVWDAMDSFDGIFLEEPSSERDIDVTPSKSGTKLDLSFGTASLASIHQLSNESIRCQDELDRIFGPFIPYILNIEDIFFDEEDVFKKQDKHKNKEKKRRKSGINLVGDHKDDKNVNDDDNNQHIIPIEEYSNPFKEELKSTNLKSFRLAQMQLHHKEFKEDSIKWLRTKKKGSHQNIRKQGKVYKSSNNSSQPVGRHKVRYSSEKAPP